MRVRTRARELALQFLYTMEMRGSEARRELPAFLRESKASVEVRGYVEELIDGVTKHRPAIDAEPLRQTRRRDPQPGPELALHEPAWLGFQPVLPAPLGREDHAGARAEGAVVEEPGRRIQGPVCRERRHAASPLAWAG